MGKASKCGLEFCLLCEQCVSEQIELYLTHTLKHLNLAIKTIHEKIFTSQPIFRLTQTLLVPYLWMEFLRSTHKCVHIILEYCGDFPPWKVSFMPWAFVVHCTNKRMSLGLEGILLTCLFFFNTITMFYHGDHATLSKGENGEENTRVLDGKLSDLTSYLWWRFSHSLHWEKFTFYFL